MCRKDSDGLEVRGPTTPLETTPLQTGVQPISWLPSPTFPPPTTALAYCHLPFLEPMTLNGGRQTPLALSQTVLLTPAQEARHDSLISLITPMPTKCC